MIQILTIPIGTSWLFFFFFCVCVSRHVMQRCKYSVIKIKINPPNDAKRIQSCSCFIVTLSSNRNHFVNTKATNNRAQIQILIAHKRRQIVWDDDDSRKRWKFSDKPNCGTDERFKWCYCWLFSQFVAFHCLCRAIKIHPLTLLLNRSFRIILNNSPEIFFGLDKYTIALSCSQGNGKVDIDIRV